MLAIKTSLTFFLSILRSGLSFIGLYFVARFMGPEPLGELGPVAPAKESPSVNFPKEFPGRKFLDSRIFSRIQNFVELGESLLLRGVLENLKEFFLANKINGSFYL